MQQKQMNIEVRTKTGKGISRQLRRAERVPGVVYGKGIEPTPISVKYTDLQLALADGRNNLITLLGGGDIDQSTVIIADLQRDALKGTLKHVDLHRINMNEKLHITVPVLLKGTAIGVKEGGLLDFSQHSLHVECLPGDIPEHIEVDITDLAIAQSIHVGKIELPENIKILDSPKTTIVSILGRVQADESEAQEEETAASDKAES